MKYLYYVIPTHTCGKYSMQLLQCWQQISLSGEEVKGWNILYILLTSS